MEDKKTRLKIDKEDQIEENVDYVFTIKDRNILEQNEQMDVLENTYIQDSSKNVISSRNENYNSFGDNKFNLEEEKNQEMEIEINDKGEVETSKEEIEKIKEKFLKNKTNKSKQFSLEQKKNVKSEFLTNEEFKKRNKKAKKVKTIPLMLSSEIEDINTAIINSSNININEDKEEEYKLETIAKKKNIIRPSENPIIPRIVNEEHKDPPSDQVLKKEESEIITDYSLFLKSIPNPKTNEEISKPAKMYTLQDLRNGTASIVNIPLPNEEIIQNKIKEEEPISSEPLVNPLIEDIPELEERPTGKGVCVALDILRKRGLLAEEEALGRYNDKSYTTNDYCITDNPVKKKPKKEINIEYRDEKGRKLKPKEMARYQSHIFHGEGPGVKKTEKQLFREQNMQKLMNSSTLMNNKTMRYMKYEQNKKNTPFAVLQGKKSSSFL